MLGRGRSARGSITCAFALVVGLVTLLTLVACSGDAGPSGAPSDTPLERATAEPTLPAPAPPSHATDAGHDAAPPSSPLDVPASLVKALGDKTYVEGNCQSVMHPGWPNAAQKCT